MPDPSSAREMEALKLLSQNMLEFSRGLGDTLSQEPETSSSAVRVSICLEERLLKASEWRRRPR